MNKKTMRLCIGVLVTGVGVLAYQLYPTQERERHNVVDSRVDGKAAGRKDHAQTAEDAAKSTQVSGDGNAAGLPMRMVNAPSFNQIVAAAALVNGAVDQKETAAFVELTTQKRIADLKVELASTEAELAKAQMQRAEGRAFFVSALSAQPYPPGRNLRRLAGKNDHRTLIDEFPLCQPARLFLWLASDCLCGCAALLRHQHF